MNVLFSLSVIFELPGASPGELSQPLVGLHRLNSLLRVVADMMERALRVRVVKPRDDRHHEVVINTNGSHESTSTLI